MVGDRWSLLVVRELLVGPKRYSDVLSGLDGVATNLLAQRLRSLEDTGVVERRVATNPNGIVYALTPWGAQLRETVEALVRWSTPLMALGQGDDAFQAEWLVLALRALLRDRTSKRPICVHFAVAGALIGLRIDQDGTRVEPRPTDQADAVLDASPTVILGLAAGALTVEQAVAAGSLRGSQRSLDTVFTSHSVIDD
ncbi:MAG: winged helix-turn-helix transcriptional regulator [Acidimicrobiales bacterium]